MSTKSKQIHKEIIEIPENVIISLKSNILQVKGPLGKTIKSFKKIPVNLEIKDNKIILNSRGTRKRDYAIFNTVKSILKNLCEGVLEGYTVKMKIAYAHFPITVKTKDDKILVENFQGERAPRIARIMGDTKIVSKGDEVVLTGPVLTDVTQTAAHLQQNTIVKNKDHRVFLDGIYIYSKTKGIEK